MKRFICDLVYALTFRNLCIGWCNSKLNAIAIVIAKNI